MPTTLISRWNYNETSGQAVADSEGKSDGAGTRLERNLDPVASDSGRSAAGDGSITKTHIPHDPAYRLASYSVVLYCQPDTAPAAGENRVIFDKDDGLPPGGCAIEQYSDRGMVKLRAYTRNAAGGTGSATWVGPSTGAALLAANTAALIVLTVDPGAAEKVQLWLRRAGEAGATKVATSAETQGWQANDADIHHLMYGGQAAGFDGVIDRVEIHDGRLSESEINDLPAPTLIRHERALVSLWSYDEESGQAVADAVGVSDGIGTGLKRDLDPLLADGGRSAAGDGSTSKTRVPHDSAYLLSSYSVVIYCQPSSIPDAGDNRVIFDKDGGNPPGGVSIEQYSYQGNSMLRAYTRNANGGRRSATWIGSKKGVAPLPVDEAALIVLTVDPDATDSVQLWLRTASEAGATKVATSSETQGWQANTVDIHHMMWGGEAGAFDGVIDRVEIYNGPLSASEINAMPPPLSIGHETGLISRWSYDEPAGQKVADSEGVSDGTGTALERNLSPVAGDGGRSAAGDGQSSRTRAPHAPAYLLPSYTVVVYCQPRSTPADGDNRIIFDKDEGLPPGGVSIEQYSDDGTSKLRAYTRNANGGRDSATWIGSRKGVAKLPEKAAALIVLTVDPNSSEKVQLWLRKAGEASARKVATSGQKQGWQANEADMHHLMYAGQKAAFDGQIDRVEVHDGRLSKSEINALPPPISVEQETSLVSRWRYDEASGQAVADSQGVSDGVGSGLERNLDPLLDDGGRSAAGDGSTSSTRVPHDPAYLLPGYSVVIYCQPDTAPATGSNRVIFDKDEGLPPGGCAIEQYNDGGTSRLRAFTRNATGDRGSATWVGSLTGVGTLPVDVAALIVLTVDPAAAEKVQLWLRKAGENRATMVATSAETQGWQANGADIHHLMYSGQLAPFDGVIDRVEVHDRRLSENEINALAAPQTISREDRPPSGEFACEQRTSGVLDTSHANLGRTTATQWLDRGGNARYDFRGTVCDNTYDPGNRTYNPSYNVRIRPALNGGCCFGGTIINGYGEPKYGPRRYPRNHGGQIQIWNADVRNFLIDGWRFHYCWDPIRTSPRDFACENVTIRSCRFTDVFDDAVENDNGSDGIVIEDCLVDGCFVFYSCRSGRGNPDGLTTIRNTLVRHEPFYDTRITGDFFKIDGRSVRFDVEGLICHISQAASTGGGGDPFFDMNGRPQKWANSRNNVIVWRGSGAYPWPVPQGFTVTKDQSVWDDAKADWLARNDHVPTIPGVD